MGTGREFYRVGLLKLTLFVRNLTNNTNLHVYRMSYKIVNVVNYIESSVGVKNIVIR